MAVYRRNCESNCGRQLTDLDRHTWKFSIAADDCRFPCEINHWAGHAGNATLVFACTAENMSTQNVDNRSDNNTVSTPVSTSTAQTTLTHCRPPDPPPDGKRASTMLDPLRDGKRASVSYHAAAHMFVTKAMPSTGHDPADAGEQGGSEQNDTILDRAVVLPLAPTMFQSISATEPATGSPDDNLIRR